MSLLVYVVATTVITNVTDHFESIKQVTIITKNPEAIIQEIKVPLVPFPQLMKYSGRSSEKTGDEVI